MFAQEPQLSRIDLCCDDCGRGFLLLHDKEKQHNVFIFIYECANIMPASITSGTVSKKEPMFAAPLRVLISNSSLETQDGPTFTSLPLPLSPTQD